MKNLDIDNLNLQNRKNLINFLEEVIYLSQQCQVNALYNANVLLPRLVASNFDPAYISEIYENSQISKEHEKIFQKHLKK